MLLMNAEYVENLFRQCGSGEKWLNFATRINQMDMQITEQDLVGYFLPDGLTLLWNVMVYPFENQRIAKKTDVFERMHKIQNYTHYTISCFLNCRSKNKNLADFSIKIESDIYAALCCTLSFQIPTTTIFVCSFWGGFYFLYNLGKLAKRGGGGYPQALPKVLIFRYC